MTNHWNDYQHSDVIMAIGGNTAENHPVSMKWIEKAREEKGAKLICVDPRYCRTAAVSDLHVPIRPGTNSAFLGYLLHYALENGKYHEEYVKYYTNATYLINEDYSFDDVEGVFSGIEEDPERNAHSYDQSSWQYQRDDNGNIRTDPDMENPNCVFQIMKEFYKKYNKQNISEVTGCPQDKLEEAAELFCSTGEASKAGNILYAMGITQFTHGAQNVRGIAVLQLLLGNMGIAGGGVNAQRGQSNVQGATDMAILYHIIPGYMGTPQEALHPTRQEYKDVETPESGWWTETPKYIDSLLKAFYGNNASMDEAYSYLPKLDGKDHSHIAMYKMMSEGKVKGMICWADNPAVSGPTAGDKRDYQKKLDWLVSVDVVENETAAFWKGPGMDPSEIDTEVFMLPAAAAYERDGTKANSGRWIQWQWKAQEAPGDAKSDLQIVYEMFKKLQEKYQSEGGTFPEPIAKMAWVEHYADDHDEDKVDLDKVCRMVNGRYYTANGPGEQVENFVGLEEDGSTACGNWLYCGYYNDPDNPACKNREREKEGIGAHPGWGFAWPLNRRIVYNRASADPDGNPWNPDAPVIWWDGEDWVGNDVPDIPGGWNFDKATDMPFIMLPEGRGRLFSFGVNDAPLPIHYEPAESPVQNVLYPQAKHNPVSQVFYPDQLGDAEEFPYIMTTYRVSEHYQSGALTRNMPWLNELMPELFIEMDEDLAEEKGISNGDTVAITSKRLKDNDKEIKAKACVTNRIKPYKVNGKTIHVVGLPFHWGFKGLATGDVANDLSPSIGDPNTTIPEFKAFLCDLRRVE